MDKVLITMISVLASELLVLISMVIKSIPRNKKFDSEFSKYSIINSIKTSKKLNQENKALRSQNKILYEQLKQFMTNIDFNTNSILEKSNENNYKLKSKYYIYSKENDVLKNNDNIQVIEGEKCIFLKNGPNYFGRKNNFAEVDVDVDINDFSVSRVHFVINIFNDSVTIEDCSSTNGTLLNQTKLIDTSAVLLKSGDIITAGNIDLVFGFNDE